MGNLVCPECSCEFTEEEMAEKRQEVVDRKEFAQQCAGQLADLECWPRWMRDIFLAGSFMFFLDFIDHAFFHAPKNVFLRFWSYGPYDYVFLIFLGLLAAKIVVDGLIRSRKEKLFQNWREARMGS